MADSTTLVDLAVRRGLLPPERAAEARVLSPDEMVARGLIDRREMDLLLKMSGQAPLLFGRYEQIEELGRGGMGVVYKCRDVKLDRVVAVKCLSDTVMGDTDRFEREARTAARLSHPNIVQVLDSGREGNQLYLTMEFIAGRSFEGLLGSGAVDRRGALAIVEQIAEALAYAHRHSVIHRDIKPENIMVDGQGRAYLTDFGLAKRVGSDERLTMTGTMMGTPAYMSPEQAAGQEVDFRSDLYSLGATLYRALTRRLPFEGASAMEIALKVINEEPVRAKSIDPNIARDLDTICQKAMNREPARRYASAQEFADDLRRYLGGESIIARPAGPLERGVRWVRRNRLLTGLVAAMLVAAGVLLRPLVIPGRLEITSTPSGAKVRIDEEEAGVTPLTTARLWPGNHRVQVALAEHDPVDVTGRVRAGEAVAVAVDLRHFKGTLALETAMDALGVNVQPLGEGKELKLGAPNPNIPLDTGRYRLTVSRENHFSRVQEIEILKDRETRLHLTLTPMERWREEFDGKVMALFLGEFNGDGILDVGAINQSAISVHSGVNGREIARFPGMGAAAAVDIDDDGRSEIVLFSMSNRVELRRLTGSAVWAWQGPAGVSIPWRGVAVHDLEGDGAPELIFTTTSQNEGVVVLDARTGRERGGAAVFAHGEAYPTFEHVNGDGVLDIIVCSQGGTLTAVDGRSLKALWAVQTGTEVRRQVVSLGDRLVVMDGSSTYRVFSMQDGVERLSVPIKGAGGSMAVADVDQDGKPELLISGERDRLACVDPGTWKARWQIDQAVVWSYPLAVDVDGDGKLEVVSGADGIVIVSHDGSRVQRYSGLRSVFHGILAADLDGDGAVEIVAAGEEGALAVIHGGDIGPTWTQDTGAYGSGGSAVDLQGDGRFEIVNLGNRTVRLLDALDGRLLREWPLTTAEIRTFHDVNGDGTLDLLAAGPEGFLKALSGKDGHEIYSVPIDPFNWESTPALIDLDGDGVPEIVVGTGKDSARGKVYAFSVTDRTPRWCVELPSLRVNRPAVAVGGPKADVIARGWNVIYRLAGADGAVVWKRALPESVRGSVVLAGDFDGDGGEEIAVAGGSPVAVHVIRASDGSDLWTFPLDSMWSFDVTVVDLDGDGAREFVFGTWQGTVMALSLKKRGPLWTRATRKKIDGRLDVSHDFDRDGVPDVVVGSDDGGLYVLSGRNGRILTRREYGTSLSQIRPVVLDVNGDGVAEACFNAPDLKMHAQPLKIRPPLGLVWDRPQMRTEGEARAAARTGF